MRAAADVLRRVYLTEFATQRTIMSIAKIPIEYRELQLENYVLDQVCPHPDGLDRRVFRPHENPAIHRRNTAQRGFRPCRNPSTEWHRRR